MTMAMRMMSSSRTTVAHTGKTIISRSMLVSSSFLIGCWWYGFSVNASEYSVDA